MSNQPGLPFPHPMKALGTKAQVSFPGQQTLVCYSRGCQEKFPTPPGENIWALRAWNAPGLCPTYLLPCLVLICVLSL